ncbi:hypothetical protein COD17_10110 [Bacillus thuringiensis]|nr:hypothetical protein COD17_10110 [Bacillus thuringiensis]
MSNPAYLFLSLAVVFGCLSLSVWMMNNVVAETGVTRRNGDIKKWAKSKWFFPAVFFGLTCGAYLVLAVAQASWGVYLLFHR